MSESRRDGRDNTLLRLNQLRVVLGGQVIVQGVSFELARREIVTLIGPNGAGKTTLIKAVLGIHAKVEGQLWRAPGLRMGYVPQQLHLPPTLPMTVARFLALTGANRTACQNALQRTGVGALLDASVHTLSGGERQRVLLARALLREPELLVLDEPTQGVDVIGQAALYELIHQLRDELGCGVLMISHDLHLVMAATDRVICLNQHVCCSGRPEQVSADPAFVELFGQRVSQTLAVYHHHHNHQHDLHGSVVLPTGHACEDAHAHD
ncbi:MAG: zinc ABC transporter ATP-binding protein ZnuC [Gammaproteobacteria bacterium]|nr:zinc ABC transporter ATP-binding protein ZnuC [Gammaproteobacteria bacterium]